MAKLLPKQYSIYDADNLNKIDESERSSNESMAEIMNINSYLDLENKDFSSAIEVLPTYKSKYARTGLYLRNFLLDCVHFFYQCTREPQLKDLVHDAKKRAEAALEILKSKALKANLRNIQQVSGTKANTELSDIMVEDAIFTYNEGLKN